MLFRSYAYVALHLVILLIGVVAFFMILINLFEGSATFRMLVLYLVYVIFAGYAFKLLIQKSSNAPRVVIYYIWFNVIFTLINFIVTNSKKEFSPVISATVWAIIISLYFLKSKRVKNTFK